MEKTKKNLRWNAKKTRIITGMAMMTAIVAALELFAGFIGIKFGTFNITLSLAPIIVGSALYGWKAGAWLGFVFGFITCFEPSTASFMTINPPATIAICIIKGTAAGLLGGVVYTAIEKRFEKKNRYAAVVTAGVVTPLVNTGIFLIGAALFFLDTLRAWGEGFGFSDVFVYMIVGLVGLNFPIELAINMVLSYGIVRIIDTVKKQSKKT